ALSAPALQWIHTHSAGIDRPFYGELKERGVVITTSSGSNSTIIAQSVLGAILALSRRFPLLRDAQQRREWLPLRGPLTPPDLAGQKAVIVGWGAIGRQVGAYLRMLELEVTAVRRSATGDSADGVRMISFEEFKSADPEYDWIVLACPLT